MAHSEGDVVWSMMTFVEFDGRSRVHIHPATVVGVVHDIVMLRFSPEGPVKAVTSGDRTICDSEADAWAAAARELAEARDRIQEAIETATARAAGSRVGEAVAT